MMASENDTWIGRLFSRIKPGSSYAAFPWKSWSKICLILETIKGIGCRINRTRSGQNWSIELVDEDGFPARPHAYQVHVLNPDISVEDYESGDYDDLKVYCYMPVSFPMCGANGPNQNGDVGDTIGSGEGYPESFSWGWHLLKEETNSEREFYVVGEVAVEDWKAFAKNGTGPTFENIECMSPQDVNTRLDPGNFDQKRWLVPIAYVNNDRVVQLLCGRPNMWMEVPDGETTPEDGSNKPGQSIQRVPGSGSGRTGMLELNGFHDPDTMDAPWKSESASAPDVDDCIDIVVRDKTRDRRRVQYVKPSDLFDVALDTDVSPGNPPGESLDRQLASTDASDGPIQLRQFHNTNDLIVLSPIGSTSGPTAEHVDILLRQIGNGTESIRPKLAYVAAATGPFWVKGGDETQNYGTGIRLGSTATGYVTISVLQ